MTGSEAIALARRRGVALEVRLGKPLEVRLGKLRFYSEGEPDESLVGLLRDNKQAAILLIATRTRLSIGPLGFLDALLGAANASNRP
jgi:hypothetical protein